MSSDCFCPDRSPAFPAPLAVSLGDPAGVGPELALKAWEVCVRRGTPDTVPFFVMGSADWLESVSRHTGAGPVRRISSAAEAREVFSHALPVLEPSVPLAASVRFGVPDPASAAHTLAAIEDAVGLVAGDEASALVTLPVNKAVLQAAGFPHPGHTDFLGVLARRLWPCDGVPVMMLAAPGLRVVPVTVHVSLREAIASLTTDRIVQTARTVSAALKRDFGLEHPRLAISALNPHAGEGGLMGTEEDTVIRPAVEHLQAAGIQADGPFPCDTLFHEEARATYDAALCMTHDQALIPIKTLDFHRAVNVTLGLPFVRTSPDHGTAYALAGAGTARADSLVSALDLACSMVRARRAFAAGAS
ncbi:4-hydroxythreonine-4-phosphate dehydrogenase PdxA [Phaeovibrio sulfidiphilus]|uniref:4-hydroxythreonine-4-phosphate dehydrogenase n=1 Tax=Phaeovibrio sulfidiphilus TaxID=1220600 RepID=A0A8J7CQ64_9PROT|nr:4-hydroxythreonine-4-phosphate dehydrogenase PdxA [Phaeovibrio sulfidiphilus]